MIATIIKSETWRTKKGHDCLKFTVEVDGDIAYGFAAIEALHLGIYPLMKFCHLPIHMNHDKTTMKIPVKTFEGKIIPFTRIQFRDSELWSIDWIQIRKTLR